MLEQKKCLKIARFTNKDLQSNPFFLTFYATLMKWNTSNCAQYIKDHSSIMSSGGWGQIMAIFDDLQYYKSSKSWVVGPKKVKNMMT